MFTQRNLLWLPGLVLLVAIVCYFSSIVAYILIAWVLSMLGRPAMFFFRRYLRLGRFVVHKTVAALLTVLTFLRLYSRTTAAVCTDHRAAGTSPGRGGLSGSGRKTARAFFLARSPIAYPGYAAPHRVTGDEDAGNSRYLGSSGLAGRFSGPYGVARDRLHVFLRIQSRATPHWTPDHRLNARS